MKFTKTEQKILSNKHEKYQKLILWIGILFFILSIAPLPYMVSQINKVKETWEKSYSSLNQKIKTETKQEAFLKSMLLRSVNETKESTLRGLKQEMGHQSVFFFLMGCFLFFNYFSSRNYLRLIYKLQNS